VSAAARRAHIAAQRAVLEQDEDMMILAVTDVMFLDDPRKIAYSDIGSCGLSSLWETQRSLLTIAHRLLINCLVNVFSA
jgi:hypothetical protein